MGAVEQTGVAQNPTRRSSKGSIWCEHGGRLKHRPAAAKAGRWGPRGRINHNDARHGLAKAHVKSQELQTSRLEPTQLNSPYGDEEPLG